MRSKISILIYTHSEYSFMWPVLVGQMNKYTDSSIKVHFLCDNSIDNIENYNIPKQWTLHVYDDNLNWTKRINSGLNEIDSDYILFLHEDWIPVEKVSEKILNEVCDVMDSNNWDYMLSYAHYSRVESQEGIFTGHEDYYFYKEDNHVFQPAIWKHSTFLEFTNALDKTKVKNEDFECLQFMRNRKCYSVQNAKTVRQYRTINSLIFPHMHVLSEGLWNFTKYPTLKQLLEEYGIDTDSRGIHTWWELDTQ